MKKLILEHCGDTEEVLFAGGFDHAIEYLEFNTFSAYVGEKTPIWVETFDWAL